ncbi:MAG: PQQ-binding-like beta-propeller repeat protein, partial [bacterium]
VSDDKYLYMHKYCINPDDGIFYGWWHQQNVLKHPNKYLMGGKDAGFFDSGLRRSNAGTWAYRAAGACTLSGHFLVYDDNGVYGTMASPDEVQAFNTDGTSKWNTAALTRVVNSVMMAGDKLFVAGARDTTDYGLGRVTAYSINDGGKLNEYDLDAAPVFNGMAAANGRLYISTMDGRLVCMSSIDSPVHVRSHEALHEETDNEEYPAESESLLESNTGNINTNGNVKLSVNNNVSIPVIQQNRIVNVDELSAGILNTGNTIGKDDFNGNLYDGARENDNNENISAMDNNNYSTQGFDDQVLALHIESNVKENSVSGTVEGSNKAVEDKNESATGEIKTRSRFSEIIFAVSGAIVFALLAF